MDFILFVYQFAEFYFLKLLRSYNFRAFNVILNYKRRIRIKLVYVFHNLNQIVNGMKRNIQIIKVRERKIPRRIITCFHRNILKIQIGL